MYMHNVILLCIYSIRPAMLHAVGKPENKASVFPKLTSPCYLHLVYKTHPYNYVHCEQNASLECVAIDKNVVILYWSALSAE